MMWSGVTVTVQSHSLPWG